MKLWRKTGWRKLSGRLYGSGRDTVKHDIPSPLIYALLNRTNPVPIHTPHPMNGVQPITMS